MSSQVAQPLSKPPADRTFVAAVTILGLVAAAQVFAVIFVFAPEIHIASMTAPKQPAAPAQDTRVTMPEAAAGQAPSSEMIERANAMLAEADRHRSVGNFDAALGALAEADHLIPNEPGILFQMALLNYEAARNVEAAELARRALALPAVQSDPAYVQIRQQAEALLAEVGRSSGSSAAVTGEPSAALMRDEVGIPIGSLLGIVDCRLVDGAPGVRNLRVATKANSKETVEPGDLKVVVYFYEANDGGEIVQTSSSLMSQWLSAPMDWANGEPELLEVSYPLPLDDRGDLPPLQYHGYVVGIYYKGELQDSRAEPVALLDQFPLKLYVSDSE